MTKVYVMSTCPDCISVKAELAGNPEYQLIDIGEMARNLKEFLRLRDSHPAFDRVKMLGNIGIPCFLYSDGSVNFSLASSRRIAAIHSSSAANADANADGATCSIDGKGC